MRSVLTRLKPNAFTYLHQLQKKMRIWRSEAREQMVAFRSCVAEFQLTKAEIDAVENLLMYLPSKAVYRLNKVASSYGMYKGPITHAGLASKALRLGFSPKVEVDFYMEKMMNTEETVHLVIDRIIHDYKNSPAGMRSSAGDETVQNLQKICRMFLLHVQQLSSQLPESVFTSEINGLREAFFAGCFDDHLLD